MCFISHCHANYWVNYVNTWLNDTVFKKARKNPTANASGRNSLLKVRSNLFIYYAPIKKNIQVSDVVKEMRDQMQI